MGKTRSTEAQWFAPGSSDSELNMKLCSSKPGSSDDSWMLVPRFTAQWEKQSSRDRFPKAKFGDRQLRQWVRHCLGPAHISICLESWLLCLRSSFLLMGTLGRQQMMALVPDPCQTHRRPRLSSGLLASAWWGPAIAGILEWTSRWKIFLCLCLYMSLNLANPK